MTARGGALGTDASTGASAGASTDAATAAAAAAVAYRYLRRPQIVVGLGAGEPGRAVVVPVADDTTFADLVAAVGSTADAAPDAVDVRAVDVRVVDTDPPVVTCADGGSAWTTATLVARARGTAAPDTVVAALPLLDRAAQVRTLDTVGVGAAPDGPVAAIPDLVAEQVRRRGSSCAVSADGVRLTYDQVWDSAAGIASDLLRAGCRPGDVVGVLCAPSAAAVVALLGVLRAGCAYLAVDPAEPDARVERMLALAGARVAVTDTTADRLPAGVHRVSLDAASPHPDRQLPATDPDQVAYVSFTSGSTGAPKGVAVAHRGVTRLVRGGSWARFTADDVFLQVAPLAFDASTIEIWGALLNGGRVHVHTVRPLDLDEVARTVADAGVSALLLTTGLFHAMVVEHPAAFARVRHVMTGGDVVSPAHVASLLERRPGITFTNGYGPTENTSYTTCWTTTVPADGARVPIGTAVDGTRVHVLDAALQPVPIGVCGEVYTSGLGLAHGYVGRPGLTAERFVADPRQHGGVMYRTGDLAFWRADGDLEFVGRGDLQVKVRGFRVEPADIEEEVRRCPAVREAVVIAQRGPDGHHRLIAYVVLAQAGHGDEAAIHGWLADRLAARVIPLIVVRDALPLTANGKVDRRALPAATRSPRPLESPCRAPRDGLERDLAEVWGEVLSVEPVGVDDTFFDLGGYSLLAADLLQRVRVRFGVDLPARHLYEHPTVAQFAASLPGAAEGGGAGGVGDTRD